MDKIMRPGTTKDGSVFVHAEFADNRLSITGVVGPKRNGDCKGSAGQICMSLKPEDIAPAPGWTPERIASLWDIWDRWHLNDMRAGCEHQRAIDTTRKVEIVTYGLTSEAYRLRNATLERAARYALTGQTPDFNALESALGLLDGWYKDKFQPPDADSPLSGCYEVKKREEKAIGWLRQDEHPDGMLSRPCEVCGYKYGSKWLHEDVPPDVIAQLEAMPDTDITPAWC